MKDYIAMRIERENAHYSVRGTKGGDAWKTLVGGFIDMDTAEKVMRALNKHGIMICQAM